MNIPLLRRIQRQIDKAPERFRMGKISQELECGTAFCIAGWAGALAKVGLGDIVAELGLYEADGSVRRLIWMSVWPAQFQGSDDGSEEAAARAIARIEHFIQTNGAE